MQQKLRLNLLVISPRASVLISALRAAHILDAADPWVMSAGACPLVYGHFLILWTTWLQPTTPFQVSFPFPSNSSCSSTALSFITFGGRGDALLHNSPFKSIKGLLTLIAFKMVHNGLVNSGRMIIVLAICVYFPSLSFMLRTDCYLVTLGESQACPPLKSDKRSNGPSSFQIMGPLWATDRRHRPMIVAWLFVSLSKWWMFQSWKQHMTTTSPPFPLIPVWLNSKEMVINPSKRSHLHQQSSLFP